MNPGGFGITISCQTYQSGFAFSCTRLLTWMQGSSSASPTARVRFRASPDRTAEVEGVGKPLGSWRRGAAVRYHAKLLGHGVEALSAQLALHRFPVVNQNRDHPVGMDVRLARRKRDLAAQSAEQGTPRFSAPGDRRFPLPKSSFQHAEKRPRMDVGGCSASAARVGTFRVRARIQPSRSSPKRLVEKTRAAKIDGFDAPFSTP